VPELGESTPPHRDSQRESVANAESQALARTTSPSRRHSCHHGGSGLPQEASYKSRRASFSASTGGTTGCESPVHGSLQIQEKLAHVYHRRTSSAGGRRDVIAFLDPKLAFDVAAGVEDGDDVCSPSRGYGLQDGPERTGPCTATTNWQLGYCPGVQRMRSVPTAAIGEATQGLLGASSCRSDAIERTSSRSAHLRPRLGQRRSSALNMVIGDASQTRGNTAERQERLNRSASVCHSPRPAQGPHANLNSKMTAIGLTTPASLRPPRPDGLVRCESEPNNAVAAVPDAPEPNVGDGMDQKRALKCAASTSAQRAAEAGDSLRQLRCATLVARLTTKLSRSINARKASTGSCGSGYSRCSCSDFDKIAATSSVPSQQSLPQARTSALPEPHGRSLAVGEVLNLDIDDWLPEADEPFPWAEIEYNRCALQLSTFTGLDEVHSLFSFMNTAQAWITFGGELQGVITDRALIEACLLLDDHAK